MKILIDRLILVIGVLLLAAHLMACGTENEEDTQEVPQCKLVSLKVDAQFKSAELCGGK